VSGGVLYYLFMSEELAFPTAQLKIERAEEHIRDLRRRALQFSDHRHDVLVEHDAEIDCDVLKFVSCQAIPPDLMCIAGDAIHNLRCALDFAMSEIEFVTTGKRTHNVMFPVRKTIGQLETFIQRRLKEKAPREVLDFIKNEVQPYERGSGDAIWQLHRLDLVDKHQLLIPHLQFEWARNIRYVDESGETFSVPEWAGAPAGILRIPTQKRSVQVTHRGHVTVDIRFGAGMPLEGRYILPTLTNLKAFVSRTLIALDREFRDAAIGTHVPDNH
jgi:hypothetical protein